MEINPGVHVFPNVSPMNKLPYKRALFNAELNDTLYKGSPSIPIRIRGYGLGSKSDVPYYFVEATAHYDGSSMIGMNPWYDLQNHGFYDVE